MRRRQFIALVGGVVALPMAVRADGGGMRSVGVLQTQPPEDRSVPTFVRALQELGWISGQNLKSTDTPSAMLPHGVSSQSSWLDLHPKSL